ncbi:hypothetical protein MIND_01012300 [Mycena indigotica]|uniref:WD40 repeat-like protein n=1 Tax=Mycena indigotica TaxID=2126181 RepID=A0A8H6VUU2_9AGAR|nr:uncharacterized protein MIND_01012300 [Mycena indigotica]KAF7294749.1 hypothetical protein MIND_01012300 [Mycena indigotica]
MMSRLMPSLMNHQLKTPCPISALAVDQSERLFAGSDDGSVRIFDSATWKLVHAIRGLPNEISSIACSDTSAWLACGRAAYAFSMSSQKLVQNASDAALVLTLGEDEDDVLNELALGVSGSHMAFSTDSGAVGVVNLSTSSVQRMKTRHSSICGIVRFIPDRPRELVSAGYDSAILHFDFLLGTTLSRRDLTAAPASEGISLSPPFVMSAALSPTGAMAVGTADGQLWIGFGGDKGDPADKSTKKKRSRKWEGLNPDDEVVEKVAEGPIVAMAFLNSSALLVSTLLGTLMEFTLSRQEEGLRITKSHEQQTGVAKVNVVLRVKEHTVVAGLTSDSKGIIEIWD